MWVEQSQLFAGTNTGRVLAVGQTPAVVATTVP
jgi:hypothetical protein